MNFKKLKSLIREAENGNQEDFMQKLYHIAKAEVNVKQTQLGGFE